MILIVSREARVLAAKHAWNCPGRSAYGLLVGSRYRLIAALPVSSVRSWLDFDQAVFDTHVTPLARQLADSYHLHVIGYYASSEMGLVDARRCPLRRGCFFLEYEMECCPHHSVARYFRNNHPLDYHQLAECGGPRLTDTINQRRILSRWNQLLGRQSYLDAEQR